MKFAQKIKIIMVTTLLVMGGIFTILPTPAHAALFGGSKDEACSGASLSASGTCDTGAAQTSIQTTAGRALQLFSFVIGVIAVVMIIVGGLKYVTSAGDPSSVNSAKNTILYAIVGLVVAASAQLIVRFVVNKL